MKKVLAMILVVLISLTLAAACAEEAVSGERNAFEYCANFARRCRIFNDDYGIEVKEPTGLYMPSLMPMMGEEGYFKITTPYGRLTVNSEDYSIVKCNFSFMSLKNGVVRESFEDLLAGAIALAALEYPDFSDNVYEIDKLTKYGVGAMYENSVDNFMLFMLDENKAEVEKEPFSYKLIFSGAYDYYLYYWKHDEDGITYDYFDIMAVAPGYHAY